MSLIILLPFALATLLIVLGAIPGWGAYVALPLSALLAAVAIFQSRPRQLAWKWAGWGTLFWACEEIVWMVARLIFQTEFIAITDPLYFAGTACWFIALANMPYRAVPSLSLLATLPALLFTTWLLLHDISLAAILQFPIIDLALLLFALPAMERAFQGQIPEGRLLWWLGLFVRVLAGSLFVWLGDTSYNAQLFSFLWVFGYTFIALGAWLEIRGLSGGLWPVAYGLLGLEVVIGLALAVSMMARADASFTLVALGLLLGYLLFAGVMLLVVADRNRRVRAERRLTQWSVLLEQLVTALPAQKAALPKDILRSLKDVLEPSFPDLCGLQANTGQSVQIGDLSGYALPLVTEGTEVGRLYFRSAPGNVQVLDALLPLVAAQVERALSHAHWHQQALTDPLTRLHNRRSLEVQGASLVALAHRQRQPVSLALLDIDHFKRVNDHYDHGVGDEALKVLADILRRNTRDEDLVLRWGGEEFVLLLYGATLRQSIEVLERIRLEFSKGTIPPISWPLTLSAGVAGGSVPGDEATLYQWLQAADQALLRAKEAGRDRLEVAQ